MKQFDSGSILESGCPAVLGCLKNHPYIAEISPKDTLYGLPV